VGASGLQADKNVLRFGHGGIVRDEGRESLGFALSLAADVVFELPIACIKVLKRVASRTKVFEVAGVIVLAVAINVMLLQDGWFSIPSAPSTGRGLPTVIGLRNMAGGTFDCTDGLCGAGTRAINDMCFLGSKNNLASLALTRLNAMTRLSTATRTEPLFDIAGITLEGFAAPSTIENHRDFGACAAKTTAIKTADGTATFLFMRSCGERFAADGAGSFFTAATEHLSRAKLAASDAAKLPVTRVGFAAVSADAVL
jgi:hypothetical protein